MTYFSPLPETCFCHSIRNDLSQALIAIIDAMSCLNLVDLWGDFPKFHEKCSVKMIQVYW